MENLKTKCKNFIDRAIDNGDIKEVNFDAIREAIHDFTLGYDLLEYTEFLELELLPNYGKVVNISGLTYDDDDLPEALELGETVYILQNDGEAGLIESLKTGTLHYIDLNRIENFN